MSDTSFREMSDADLQARATAMDEAPAATETEADPTPAVEETAAPEVKESAPADPANPEKPWNPEGPGDTAKALREAREQAKAEAARAAAAEARAREYETRAEAERQRYAQEQYDRQLQEKLATMHPEEQREYLQALQQQNERDASVRHQYEQARQADRIQIANDLAREAMGEEAYTALVQNWNALLADPVLGPTINTQAVYASKNPVASAKQILDRLAPDTAAQQKAFEAKVEEAVNKKLAEALAKNNAPVPRHQSIGHVAATSEGANGLKTARQMSDAELKAKSRA